MLHEGEFHENELVSCYRPPRLREVYPGNHVMLASGGPDMIVADTRGDQILCMWEHGVVVERMWFHIDTLTCYGAK